MASEERVLACVDQSRFANYVADYAAWAALRLQAPLEFLHIIDLSHETATLRDRSGAIGIDAKEQLLTRLSDDDEARNRLAREQGRMFLTGLRERAVAMGVEAPDIRQRHGELQQTLREQQDEVRLFVLGRRGESAEMTQRDLGRHVESVVRSLNKPILTVTQDFSEPRRVLIAFDGSAITRRGVQMVADSTLFAGLSVHVLMSGKPRNDADRHLQWASQTLTGAGFDTHVEMTPGDPERVIAHAIAAQDVDMLIMGAYGHSPIRTWLFGSKTTDLLRSARIPTLLLR
jgi:nucleotide-binding universal stress UspA family protein